MTYRAYTADLSFYAGYIEALAAEARSGLPEALRRMVAHAPRLGGMTVEAAQRATPNVDDARAVYAGEHGFTDWSAFKAHLAAIAADSSVEPFCAFIRDVEGARTDAVAAALDADPDLVGGIASTAKTPLHSAGVGSNTAMAHLLLERGANPRTECPLPGGTPLAHALVWGAVEIADVIAAVDVTPRNLRTLAGLGDIDGMESMWNEAGHLAPEAFAGREYYRPNYGWYPWRPAPCASEVLSEAFIYAATNGRIRAAEFLLRRGAAVDGQAYRTTALIRAAWKGRLETVDWLLAHGAALNGRGWLGGHAKGVTALHMAASNDHVEMTQRLLSLGADATARDALYNGTPLGWAEFHGCERAAALLR